MHEQVFCTSLKKLLYSSVLATELSILPPNVSPLKATLRSAAKSWLTVLFEFVHQIC